MIILKIIKSTKIYHQKQLGVIGKTSTYSGEYFEPSRLCSEITEEIFMGYSAFMRKHKKVNDVTVCFRLRQIRVFLYYCMEKGYTKKFDIELPKVDVRMKTPYSNEEIEKLLRKPNLKTAKFIDYRSWVITNYLFGTGNRLGTITEILTSDINFSNNTICLSHMKNREEQIIPLCMSLARILKEWILYRNTLGGEYLFCTVSGGKLSKRTIQETIANYNKRRGVAKTSVHLYRHKFALDYASKSNNVFKLQRLLNHKTLEMSRKYVKLSCQDLKEDYDKYNPLEQFNNKNNKCY